MSYQEDFDIAQRYDLLCRASQSSVEQDGQRLQLAADLAVLDKIINYDLPELARSGSPDHFADILKNLNLELEHFREFCEFPDLAQKVVVGVGGAFSAGKSSLINTLLGKKRLVVEIDPTTSLPTYLLHGKQEQITALNLFRRRVTLSQDEFASLTHEEKIKYGSQIAGLLRSAFVCDPDFAWKNIALLDTPGYSKPDSEQWSERTDESVARSQLNLSNFIIWVVSATQGTISEDDLKFLATLNADIPKLIVVSRADAKTPEDVAKIVALVKQTTAERGINVLDVIPVSARKKNDYPVQPIIEFLERWNEQKRSLSFAQNFKRNFVDYSRFVQGKQQQAKTKLEQINKLLFLSDHAEQTQIVEKLKHIEKDSNKEWNDLPKNLEELQNQFFKKMNQLADSIRGYKEQLVDIETLLKAPNCSAEILQSYAERLDDEELLNLIYQHKNCPQVVLERALSKPVGSLSTEKIINIFSHGEIYCNENNLLNHYNILSSNEKLSLVGKNIGRLVRKYLSKEKDKIILYELLKNQELNNEDLLNIAYSSLNSFYLSKTLLDVKNLCMEVQAVLIKNNNVSVRASLAKLTKIEEIQAVLSGDESERVRNQLLLNDSLHDQVKNELLSVSSNFRVNQESKHFSIVQQGDDWDKQNLAENWWISKNIQLALIDSYDESIRGALASNPTIDEEIQLKLIELIGDSWIDSIKYSLIDNRNLTGLALYELIEKDSLLYADDRLFDGRIKFSSELQQKFFDKGFMTRCSLSKYPNLDEDIQIKFINSWDVDNIIDNGNLTKKVQNLLIDNGEYLDRMSLNEKLFDEVYSRLAHIDCNKVRVNLIRNKVVKMEIKEYLASLSNFLNFSFDIIINNKNIDHFGQIVVLNEDDVYVKRLMVEKSILNENIQNSIVEENNETLIGCMLENPSLIEILQLKFVNHSEPWFRRSLAKNTSLIERGQFILAKDEDVSVRDSLASNTSITNDVQLILVNDSDESVVKRLAENKGLSIDAQIKIIEIGNKDIIYYLARNENLHINIQEILSSFDCSDYDSRSILNNLASNRCLHSNLQEKLVLNDDLHSSLASNVNIIEKVQNILLSKSDNYINEILYENINCSVLTRRAILES
ncbi:dynamin family protein [Acinetobacter modestus]|uniref:dynamin family protein n=1 Tax=Acinetobacter modestus TaxID=1776740 RepID=UPI00202F14B3|nr:dynamin family protein [Acinetobacter modestus]MCM1958313.1 dynamin family protein [Acinetobacter modestus]